MKSKVKEVKGFYCSGEVDGYYITKKNGDGTATYQTYKYVDVVYMRIIEKDKSYIFSINGNQSDYCNGNYQGYMYSNDYEYGKGC